MAMPPTPAASPAPAAGADPTMAGGAPPDDMGAADDDAQPPVLFTVMGPPEGPYVLAMGDEDDDDVGGGGDDTGAPAPGGDDDQEQTFDTAPALIQAIMKIVNPSKGADDAFASGFKGDKGSPPGM